MKKKVAKRQASRLWDAIQIEEFYPQRGDFVCKPATRPMRGKSALRLVGSHAKAIEEYFNGDFVRYGEKGEMPKFNANRKYMLVVEYDYGNSDYPMIWVRPVTD